MIALLWMKEPNHLVRKQIDYIELVVKCIRIQSVIFVCLHL